MTENLSRRRVLGLTVGSTVVAVAGCLDDGGDDGTESPESSPGMDDNETDDAQAEPQANVITVGPESNPTSFEPDTLSVESGTTVTFEWATDNHNIVVERRPDGANWNGQEAIENAGYTHEHTFDTAGEYEFICEPHAPNMEGVIVVDGGGTDTGTDSPDNGTDSPENSTDAPANDTQPPDNTTDAPTNGTDDTENSTESPKNSTAD